MGSKTIKGCLLVGLMGVSSYLSAESLLDVLEKAKQSDPQLLGAGFQKAAVAEQVTQSRARLLPGISYSIEEKDSSQQIIQTPNVVFGSGSQSYSTSTNTLTLSQSVFNYEHWMRFYQSKVARTRSEYEFQQAYQDMLLRVGEGYFETLKAREQLSSIAAEKEALKGHLDYADASVKAGIGRQSEFQDAKARYLTSVAQEIEYKKLYSDARYNLLEIIGYLPGRLEGLRKKLPLHAPEPQLPEPWVEQGLAKNPNVMVANERVAEARYEVKAQKGGHLPTLDLLYQDYTQESGGSLYGGESEIDQRDLTLTLNIPIFQGGAVSSRKREAIQNMYKAQEELVHVKRQIENQAQSAFQGVISSIAQIEALKESQETQLKVLENREKGFSSGVYSIIHVLDARQDLAIAEQNYIAARNDYFINYLRLKRTAGVLMDSDLVEINNWLIDASSQSNEQ